MSMQLRPVRTVDCVAAPATRAWSKANPLQGHPWSAPPRPPSVVLTPDDSYLENEHLRPDTPSDAEDGDDGDDGLTG